MFAITVHTVGAISLGTPGHFPVEFYSKQVLQYLSVVVTKCVELLQINCPKKETQKWQITTNQFIVLLFLLNVCTTFSEGHREIASSEIIQV